MSSQILIGEVEDRKRFHSIVVFQGASGVGIGNFEEIGPLDTNLNARNSTWLQIADLLFVVFTVDPMRFEDDQ